MRVNGIVYDKEKGMYKRVGFKTEASLRFFVLHDFFRRIGFVEWAAEQGDNFIFRLLANTSDPGDVASKRVNRLLKKAGAIGMNVEVAHSLRHGAKEMFIEEDLDDEATGCRWAMRQTTSTAITASSLRCAVNSAKSWLISNCRRKSTGRFSMD